MSLAKKFMKKSRALLKWLKSPASKHLDDEAKDKLIEVDDFMLSIAKKIDEVKAKQNKE
jgi:hypothetical protein